MIFTEVVSISIVSKPFKLQFAFKLYAAVLFNDISYTVNKANKVLGSIKRSVGTANSNVFSMLYEYLVRPVLEYEAPVWCP